MVIFFNIYNILMFLRFQKEHPIDFGICDNGGDDVQDVVLAVKYTNDSL